MNGTNIFLLSESSPDDAFWTMHLSLNSALIQFHRTMPKLRDQRELQDGEFSNQLNPSVLVVRGTIYFSMIVMAQIEAENDEGEYERCMMLARKMAHDARLVGNTAIIYAHACLAVSAQKTYTPVSVLACGR